MGSFGSSTLTSSYHDSHLYHHFTETMHLITRSQLYHKWLEYVEVCHLSLCWLFTHWSWLLLLCADGKFYICRVEVLFMVECCAYFCLCYILISCLYFHYPRGCPKNRENSAEFFLKHFSCFLSVLNMVTL